MMWYKRERRVISDPKRETCDVVWRWVNSAAMTPENLPVPATQLLACQSHSQTISGDHSCLRGTNTKPNLPQNKNTALPRGCMEHPGIGAAPPFFSPTSSVSVIPPTALPGPCPTATLKLGSQYWKQKKTSGIHESPLVDCDSGAHPSCMCWHTSV